MTLEEWRKANRYSRPAFLKLASPKGLTISVQTLYNWETGRFQPDVSEAEIIRQITGGKVLPASFFKAS